MSRTHAGGGSCDPPLAQRRCLRQPEAFGDHAQDGVLAEPLAEAGPSGVLKGAEPQASSSQVNFNHQCPSLAEVRTAATHADYQVHRAAVRPPPEVKGHNTNLDLLAGPVAGSVRLDEGGEVAVV